VSKVRCPSCGEFLQSGATTCIALGCADRGQPIAPDVAHAAELHRSTPTARMLALNPLAPIVAALALLAVAAMSAGLVADVAALQATGWVSFLATIAAFVPWLRRARKNFDALPGPDPQLAERPWLPIGVAGIVNGLLADVVAGSFATDIEGQRGPRKVVAVWTVFSAVAALLTVELSIPGQHGTGAREVAAGFLIICAIGFAVLVLMTTAAQVRRFTLNALPR
jgi:hypothetical protein